MQELMWNSSNHTKDKSIHLRYIYFLQWICALVCGYRCLCRELPWILRV